MNKLFTLLAILISFTVAAQPYTEFAPVGTKWTYATHNDGPGFRYPMHMNSIAQLTYDGKLCKQLTTEDDTFYAYRDSLKMYVHSKLAGTHWQLICDFEKNIGDTLIAASSYGGRMMGDSFTIIITGKGDTTINGRLMPYLRFNNTMFTNIAILNLGFIGTPLTVMNGIFIPEFGISFRCYSEGQTVWGFKMPGVGNCDTLHNSGIVTIPKGKKAIVYPNPANDYLQVVTSVKGATIVIKNLVGRTLITADLTNSIPNKISVNKLADGIYVYNIVSNGEVVGNGRFVKE